MKDVDFSKTIRRPKRQNLNQEGKWFKPKVEATFRSLRKINPSGKVYNSINNKYLKLRLNIQQF